MLNALRSLLSSRTTGSKAKRRASKYRKNTKKRATIGDVKRIISLGRENKMCSRRIENTTHNSAIGAADIVSILPAVQQGTTQNQRVGNVIKPRGLYVKVSVTLSSTYGSVNTSAINCRLFMLSYKVVRNSVLIPTQVPVNYLLKQNTDSGTGSNVAYDGTMFNHQCPVNYDLFNVHHQRTFTFYPQRDVVPGDNAGQTYNITRNFTFKIKCPSSFKYDPVSLAGNYPANFAPFYCIGYSYSDGSSPDLVNQRISSVVQSFLYYEDA